MRTFQNVSEFLQQCCNCKLRLTTNRFIELEKLIIQSSQMTKWTTQRNCYQFNAKMSVSLNFIRRQFLNHLHCLFLCNWVKLCHWRHSVRGRMQIHNTTIQSPIKSDSDIFILFRVSFTISFSFNLRRLQLNSHWQLDE